MIKKSPIKNKPKTNHTQKKRSPDQLPTFHKQQLITSGRDHKKAYQNTDF
jgi:hypothetical protein